jgi:hypothetical protein
MEHWYDLFIKQTHNTGEGKKQGSEKGRKGAWFHLNQAL